MSMSLTSAHACAQNLLFVVARPESFAAAPESRARKTCSTGLVCRARHAILCSLLRPQASLFQSKDMADEVCC